MEEATLGHTPGPWQALNRSGAGLQIMAPVVSVMRQQADPYADRMPAASPIFDLQDGKGLQYIMAYEIWTRFTPEWWDQMQQANARLIAAAPELLAALVDCRRALEVANFTQELAVVDAAIAKATGGAA